MRVCSFIIKLIFFLLFFCQRFLVDCKKRTPSDEDPGWHLSSQVKIEVHQTWRVDIHHYSISLSCDIQVCAAERGLTERPWFLQSKHLLARTVRMLLPASLYLTHIKYDSGEALIECITGYIILKKYTAFYLSQTLPSSELRFYRPLSDKNVFWWSLNARPTLSLSDVRSLQPTVGEPHQSAPHIISHTHTLAHSQTHTQRKASPFTEPSASRAGAQSHHSKEPDRMKIRLNRTRRQERRTETRCTVTWPEGLREKDEIKQNWQWMKCDGG